MWQDESGASDGSGNDMKTFMGGIRRKDMEEELWEPLKVAGVARLGCC
jgi:hypothetical protein